MHDFVTVFLFPSYASLPTKDHATVPSSRWVGGFDGFIFSSVVWIMCHTWHCTCKVVQLVRCPCTSSCLLCVCKTHFCHAVRRFTVRLRKPVVHEAYTSLLRCRHSCSPKMGLFILWKALTHDVLTLRQHCRCKSLVQITNRMA